MFQLLNCVRCWNFEDFRFQIPQRKKSHAERSSDLAGHVMSPDLEITWLGNKFLTAAMESRAVCLVALSGLKNVFSFTG
jgi:hypothetical protein